MCKEARSGVRESEHRRSKMGAASLTQVALQANGGRADFWYLDDGDILCHPVLASPYLQAFDMANVRTDAERNQQKADVVYYVSDLDTAPPDWKIKEFRPLTSVYTAVHGNVTLGVAVGLCHRPTGKNRRHPGHA